MMPEVKIYSIIVSYNGMQCNWIQKCLDSLLTSSVKTEIIVIDNASTDETVSFIQKNYPRVDLILANENLGFAKANNIGIKKAYEQGADYVFLLNQDAWIEESTIKKLAEAFEQLLEAGIISPIHLNGNKTNFDRGFLDYTQYNTPGFASDQDAGRFQDFYETTFVNAAAWLISRKCIETVGGFDTLLFYHYGEDRNYCQRVFYQGLKIYIATTTTICHDREERKTAWSSEYKSKRDEVWLCCCYADILSDDKILHKLKLILSYNAITKLLKLQIKSFCEQIALYKKIKKSRTQNKKKGLNWL